jgi:multiple sugar transport system substrate-binding protein
VAQQRDKMATQAIAGQLEDIVATVVQWTTEFAANGWIADLTPRLGELDRADWPEASWTASSFKGKIYAVPNRRDNFAIFYNKDLFQAAGISKFPETIDELVEVGKKLTKDGVSGISLVGADHPQTTTQFLSFMLMFGNTMFSTDFTKSVMNEPSAAQAAKFYADLVNVHKIAQPTAATDIRDEAAKLWMAGKGAMQLNGPWQLPVIKQQAPSLNYGVGLVPSLPGKPRLSLVSGWDWAISSKTKYPDQAWDLIKF